MEKFLLNIKPREYQKQIEILDQVVTRNPEIYKSLEQEINKLYGKSDEAQKGDGEAAKIDPRISELRKSEENRIIAEFYKKFGIDQMESENKTEMKKKVSVQLAEMLDPGGNKPISQILSEIKLPQLPKYLENAYWIANKEALMDRGSLNQDMASIGSISTASSGKSDMNKGLTDREKTIAEKLGVDPDKYLKRKQEMLKE